MPNHALDKFVHTRVEMRRANGSRIYGWIHQFSSTGIVIGCKTRDAIEQGEILELHGRSQAAATSATVCVSGVHGDSEDVVLHCLLQGNLRLEPGKTGARNLTYGLSAVVMLGDGEVEAEVIDVSREGMALRCDVGIVAEREVVVIAKCRRGPLALRATVRYCKDEPDGTFRIGLQFKELSRLEVKKWAREIAA